MSGSLMFKGIVNEANKKARFILMNKEDTKLFILSCLDLREVIYYKNKDEEEEDKEDKKLISLNELIKSINEKYKSFNINDDFLGKDIFNYVQSYFNGSVLVFNIYHDDKRFNDNKYDKGYINDFSEQLMSNFVYSKLYNYIYLIGKMYERKKYVENSVFYELSVDYCIHKIIENIFSTGGYNNKTNKLFIQSSLFKDIFSFIDTLVEVYVVSNNVFNKNVKSFIVSVERVNKLLNDFYSNYKKQKELLSNYLNKINNIIRKYGRRINPKQIEERKDNIDDELSEDEDGNLLETGNESDSFNNINTDMVEQFEISEEAYNIIKKEEEKFMNEYEKFIEEEVKKFLKDNLVKEEKYNNNLLEELKRLRANFVIEENEDFKAIVNLDKHRIERILEINKAEGLLEERLGKSSNENIYNSRYISFYNSSESKKKRGDVTGEFDEFINSIISVKLDYTKILRNAILFKLQSDQDTRTWSKKNIYYRDIKIPGYKDKEEYGDVFVFIDTSGSITTKELEKFFGVIVELKKYFTNFYLVQHDVDIKKIDCYKGKEISIDIVEGIKICGRGGTSHEKVFDYIEKKFKEDENISLVIFLTDFVSDVESLDKSKYTFYKYIKTIWIISNNKPNYNFNEINGVDIYIEGDNI